MDQDEDIEDTLSEVNSLALSDVEFDEETTSHEESVLDENRTSTAHEKKRKPGKQYQKSVRINGHIIKYIMNSPEFSKDLRDQLSQLEANIQWKPNAGLITVLKKSDSKFVKSWHDKCRRAVLQFSNRFHRENFEVEEVIWEKVKVAFPDLQEMLRSSAGASCWIEEKERKLIVVSLRGDVAVKVAQILKQSLHFLRQQKGN